MVTRVCVRVVGFSDVERHALNTLFRLSQQPQADREIGYEAWLEGDTEPPQMVLVDGAHGNASQELTDMHLQRDIGLIWVGAIAPVSAWRTFTRPLRWPDVLTAMDTYFGPRPSLDFDLDSETLPAELEEASYSAAQEALPPRALVADSDRETRLYLQSKLAAYGITYIDEAHSLAQVHALLTQHRYQFICIDVDMNDQDPWQAVNTARLVAPLLITSKHLGVATKVTARLHGYHALQKPLHPDRLAEVLSYATALN
jgi:CheY-like chemotaxis protein